MKYTLTLTLGVLIVAGVSVSVPDNNFEALSPKEEIRLELVRELNRLQRRGIQAFCPKSVSPKQLEYGNQKLEELGRCGNATIDLFIDKLDDNIKMEEFDNITFAARRIAGPVCEIFDDIFRCIGEIGPVIDMCLNENEKIFKNKIFAIVPLIHQTACLRNGGLIADIAEHNDGVICITQTLDSLFELGLLELLESDSNELFGDTKVCQNFSNSLQRVYVKVGECSLGVLEMVKEMLGFFCEGTNCERYVHDLQCY